MRPITIASGTVLVLALAGIGYLTLGSADAAALRSANVKLGAGDARGAAEDYRTLIAKGGRSASLARVYLGVALERQSDLDGSIRELREAADSGGVDVAPRAYAYLGYSLYRKGDSTAAVAAYVKAKELGLEGFPELHFNLGTALKSLSRYAEAATELEAYRNECGGSASPLATLELAETRFNLEQYAESHKELERYVASDPARKTEPRVLELNAAFAKTVAAAKRSDGSKAEK